MLSQLWIQQSLASVGRSLLLGGDVVHSRLWENRTREFIGPRVPKVKLPLHYYPSSSVNTLMNQSLSLCIT